MVKAVKKASSAYGGKGNKPKSALDAIRQHKQMVARHKKAVKRAQQGKPPRGTVKHQSADANTKMDINNLAVVAAIGAGAIFLIKR